MNVVRFIIVKYHDTILTIKNALPGLAEILGGFAEARVPVCPTTPVSSKFVRSASTSFLLISVAIRTFH
jgi:hypothetical protein